MDVVLTWYVIKPQSDSSNTLENGSLDRQLGTISAKAE